MTSHASRLVGLMLTLALCACATPHVQSPLTPPPGFAGPTIADRAFVVQDGARLPFLHWGPQGTEPDVVIVALHGMNDHKAAYRLAGPWWAEHGIATYAYDQRGFGQAPGRGEWGGDLLLEDLRTITGLVRARHPGARIAVVGESMGGAVAIAAMTSDRPPAADRVVLLAPAVWGWSSQSPLNRAGLWVAARAMGDRAVEAPEWAVRLIVSSDNRVELIRNGRDPDSLFSTRFDTLSGLVGMMETASAGLGGLTTPTLLLYGADDQVIRAEPMRRALERAGPTDALHTAYYRGGYHILNRDLQAEVVYRDVAAWLRDAEAPLPSGAPPVLEAMRTTGPRPN